MRILKIIAILMFVQLGVVTQSSLIDSNVLMANNTTNLELSMDPYSVGNCDAGLAMCEWLNDIQTGGEHGDNAGWLAGDAACWGWWLECIFLIYF